LASLRPSNISHFTEIDDFAKEKAENIGLIFIEKIKEFCGIRGLKMDNFKDKDEDVNKESKIVKNFKKNFIQFIDLIILKKNQE
jgi:hypothetical protein